MPFKYFAYGSNLLLQRLHTGGSKSASAVHVAKLLDYELCFVGSSQKWRGAVATIEPRAGSHVWGVVYLIDDCHRAALDRQEASYRPITVEVTTSEGEELHGLTYRANLSPTECNKPSPYYKHTIVEGAKASALPAQYVEKLRSIATNSYVGECELYDEVVEQCLESGLKLPAVAPGVR